MLHLRRPVAIVFVLAACARGDRPAADTIVHAPSDTIVETARPASMEPEGLQACVAPTGADTLCYHATRAIDFANDGHPFTVTVDGRGPRADAMQVRLRIRRGDTTYHRADWTTSLYGRYDRHAVSADSSRRRAEAQLARILAPESVRTTSSLLGTGDRERALRETIGFDIAVDAERRRLGLLPADSLPMGAAQSPPPVTDTARVRALATELLTTPALRYFTGGEATYAVAWSPTERRFVVVYSCC